VLPHFSDSSMSGFERCRAVVSDIFLTRRVVGRRFPSVFPLPRCCSRHFRAAGRPRPVLLLLLLLLLLLVLVLVFPSVFPLPRCCSRHHFRAAGRPRPLDVCAAAATAATTAASADYTCCCYCRTRTYLLIYPMLKR
jgi:hypothetical protein